MIRQVVARHPDGRYTVITHDVGDDGTSRTIREVPASHRDVAQATLAGAVIDIEGDS